MTIDEIATKAAEEFLREHAPYGELHNSAEEYLIAIIAAALRKVRDDENKACEQIIAQDAGEHPVGDVRRLLAEYIAARRTKA